MITFAVSYTALSVALKIIFVVRCYSSMTEKVNTDWPIGGALSLSQKWQQTC